MGIKFVWNQSETTRVNDLNEKKENFPVKLTSFFRAILF